MNEIKDNETKEIVTEFLKTYESGRFIDSFETRQQPDVDEVSKILDRIVKMLYPGFYHEKHFLTHHRETRLLSLMEDIIMRLKVQVSIALRHAPEYADLPDEEIRQLTRDKIDAFIKQLTTVREYLETDLDAFFDGDPAAFNRTEIILSYPGFYAITVSRIAHELFLLKIPLIPRMMTEEAHRKTGIDIHPGATIGKYFFIDHGTGIVIGETTEIGEHVKIYQGVTLGALSTRGGQNLRGKKRHPKLEDNVTVYSGASILGGNTVIGADSIIGGNTFITSSIARGARVSVKTQELVIDTKNHDVKEKDVKNNWSN